MMAPLSIIASYIMQTRKNEPKGWAEKRTHEALNEYCKKHFGTEDIYNRSYTEEESFKLREHLEELRTIIIKSIPDDGSDILDYINPVMLPLWIRLAFLPDFIAVYLPGGNGRLWSIACSAGGMVAAVRDKWGNETGERAPRVLYAPVHRAPDLDMWVQNHYRIQWFLGYPVRFTWHQSYGVLELRPASSEKDQGSMEIKTNELSNETSELQEGVESQEAVVEELIYTKLPFEPSLYPSGHLANGYLYFGEQFLDRTKGGHWLKIDDLTHFLVMGTSGFGKSVFLNQILQGVCHNLDKFEQVHLVDLKGGVELFPYQALGQQFRVTYQLEDMPALAAELVATIRDRLEQMRAQGVRMWPGPKTLLVIDEFAQIQLAPETTKEEKQAKHAMLADLNKISMLGRAAGVIIWAQLQKGTTDVMDSSFRANLASQVCFKVPNKLTAAGMFGSTDELEVDPVKLPKGRFILFDAGKGETYYLQARVFDQ